MRNFTIYFWIILGLITSVESYCQSDTTASNSISSVFPPPVGYVNDFEDILTSPEEDSLTKIITDFESQKTNEISVITVSDFTPFDTAQEYAIAIGNEWGVGKKDKDNGLVIVVSKLQREIFMSTGTGTEKHLTNEECQTIIDRYAIPEFKQSNYYRGIVNTVKQALEKWD